MRILITGGFGFIGGRLAQYLQLAGYQVVLGSRSVNRTPDWLPESEVVETKWQDTRALEESCTGIDVVIQAAGMNAQESASAPVSALEFNGLATARLLYAAKKMRVKRFIYLSTAHVYASPLIGIINEDTCPHNLHPYATSHLVGENMVLAINKKSGIECIVLRLSNVFGAPVHKDVNCWMLLVNDLCRQVIQEGKMELYSSGVQQRDFIEMNQVCHVIETMSSPSFKFNAPALFNIGSGESRSVLEMSKLVQQRCNFVFGVQPELKQMTIEENEQSKKLEYKSNNLDKTLCITQDYNTEIDNLLRFCYSNFKKNELT